MQKPNKNQKSKSSESDMPMPKRIEVVFTLECSKAKEVYICGDFNQWSPTNLRMFLRNGNGHWEKKVALTPGRYEYKFVVDGEWIHNSYASENVPNAHGTVNSVIHVQ